MKNGVLINKFVSFIVWATMIAIIGLFIILAYQIVSTIKWDCICTICEKSSVDNLLGILVPFFIAAVTLKKAIDIQTVDSLARLRTMLNAEKKAAIHKELIKEKHGDNELDVEVLDYIGTIELGAIMHRKGLISDQELYNQFGYRVENIVNSSLFAKIEDDKLYYKDFFYIKDVVEKIGNKK